MLLFYQPLTYQTPKNRGGLADFGKTRTLTGFSSLWIDTFHRERTENSPKKNEVSGFGFLTPCHN
jgi:hypothetical protein